MMIEVSETANDANRSRKMAELFAKARSERKREAHAPFYLFCNTIDRTSSKKKKKKKKREKKESTNCLPK
jgi:phytoene/squalene synthetase